VRGQGPVQERVELHGIGGTRRGACRVADVGTVDELGYLALPAEAAATIFQIVSQRCLKTSTVLTGNRRVGAHQVGNFDEHPWGIPVNELLSAVTPLTLK